MMISKPNKIRSKKLTQSARGERWLFVSGTDDMYEVSNHGRVRSWVRKNGLPGKRDKPLMLKTPTNSKGYVIVGISGLSVGVHRLVAKAFIPNPCHYKTVNHKNGIKDDNHVDNLEWASIQQNIRHACKNNLRGDLSGSNNGQAKLTEGEIPLIRNMIGVGISHGKIAKKFGVSRALISRISRGLAWSHVK